MIRAQLELERQVSSVMFLILCFLCWFPAVYSEVRLTQMDLPCSGEEVVLQCTLQERVVIWDFPGGDETLIPASSKQQFGNFRGCPVGVVNGSFTSTLTFPAENGMVITCSSVEMNRNTSLTVTVQGPPSAPNISCVGLSEDVSGAVNVTVNWTLSAGDSAHLYIMNITTNATEAPYGGLLNITTASVTLTGFMAGYEYNITVRGVNCGNLEGSESEPLTIRPQVPDTPNLSVCAVYDMVNGTLQIIESTWNEMDNVTVSEDCPNGQDIRASFELSYTTDSGTHITTCVVNGTECSNGTCQSNTADSRCQPPVSRFSGEGVTMSVTARNIVGSSNPAVSRIINGTNNVDLGVRIDTTNISSAFVECTVFQPGYTCTIDYGTDPSYTNLVYRDSSSTQGQMATITLSQRLRTDTTYYYIVSAVSSSQCVKVQGRFRAGCNLTELWNLPAANATFLTDVSLLNDAAQYPSCDDGSIGSVVLVNTTLNTATVAYYTGTTSGSRACFICDDGYELSTTITERFCQGNGLWSGNPTMCVCRLPLQTIALITLGGFAMVVALFSAIVTFIDGITAIWIGWNVKQIKSLQERCRRNKYEIGRDKTNHCWHALLVATATFLVIGVILWITVGVMVSKPPNGNACDPSWRTTRDGLIGSAFAVSILAFFLAVAAVWVHVCYHTERIKKKEPLVVLLVIALISLIIGVGLLIASAVLVYIHYRTDETDDERSHVETNGNSSEQTLELKGKEEEKVSHNS